MREVLTLAAGLAAASAVALSPAAPRGALQARASPLHMADFEPAAPVLTGDNLRDCLDRALDKNPKKYVALLGSTGSIGTQTLDICREYPDYFEVVSIAAGANVELLAQQASRRERERERERSGDAWQNTQDKHACGACA